MPKLIWREPIETTTITSGRRSAKRRGGPRTGRSPAGAGPRQQVLTLGDIAGRESGGLVVLLVAVGALTLPATSS